MSLATTTRLISIVIHRNRLRYEFYSSFVHPLKEAARPRGSRSSISSQGRWVAEARGHVLSGHSTSSSGENGADGVQLLLLPAGLLRVSAGTAEPGGAGRDVVSAWAFRGGAGDWAARDKEIEAGEWSILRWQEGGRGGRGNILCVP